MTKSTGKHRKAQIPDFNDGSAIQIPLTKGHITLIDWDDRIAATLLWYASMDRKRLCYAMRKERQVSGSYKTILLHRFVMESILERPLNKDEFIDHINGNSLDNRRENLRIATNAQNLHNRKSNSTNTSGYKGVYWHKPTKKWRAKISVMGKIHYLGQYNTPEEAYAVYCKAATLYFGEFA